MAKASKSGGSPSRIEELGESGTTTGGGEGIPLEQFDPEGVQAQAVPLAQAQAIPEIYSRFDERHYEAQRTLIDEFMSPPVRLNEAGALSAQSLSTPSGESSRIVGCGLGEKLIDGRHTGQAAIVIYVTKKVPDRSMPSGAVIPSEINGVLTDVIEAGPFVTHAGFQLRERPARCGASVGEGIETGTIAALVQLDNGKLALISNNHVLAAVNRAKVGDPVIQPGLADSNNPGNMIARLERFLTIDLTGGTNMVDAAAAHTSFANVSPSHHTFTINPMPVEPREKQAVRKEGRTTGLTVGQIQHVNVTTKVGYDLNGDGFSDVEAVFTGQVMITASDGRPFSKAGDSGSLIVDFSSFQPTALLVAGDGSNTIATPITQVIQQLKILRFIAQVEQ